LYLGFKNKVIQNLYQNAESSDEETNEIAQHSESAGKLLTKRKSTSQQSTTDIGRYTCQIIDGINLKKIKLSCCLSKSLINDRVKYPGRGHPCIAANPPG